MMLETFMQRKTTFVAAAAIAAIAGIAHSQQPVAKPASPADAHRQLINTYCIGCHSARAKVGNLVLEGLSLDKVADNAVIWEKVIRKLNGGQMPPQGMPRPQAAASQALTQYLAASLDKALATNTDPGRAPIHRLNRTEYANAIRDLLAVEIDPAEYLPPDDESDGFDNIADALRVSPTLLDQYLVASRKISALAVGDMEIVPISRFVQVPPDLSQEDHIEGLPLGTRGGVLIQHNFPLDADYDFSVFLIQNIVGYVTGLEYAHELEISIDGERVFLAPVGGEDDNRMSDENLGVAKDTLDARLKSRIPVKAGRHSVAVAFLRRNSAPTDEPLQSFTRDHDLQNMNGLPLVDHVQITGPFKPMGPGDTPSRNRIFTCQPKSPTAEAACAKQILSTLSKRAYRRPVSDTDLASLMNLYEAGRKDASFEKGVQNSLRLVLANPKFLFRSEPDPKSAAPGSVRRLTDLELASRLSFFLWSSLPDEELINLAAQGKLKNAQVLDQQVKRMMADPRADAMVSNFAGQWLLLRNLNGQPRDPNVFPNYDANLRDAFRKETELLFQAVMREDRNVLELLTADYTFVNQRLAQHYGIQGVYGSNFRRVKIADPNRRGILGQGSFLTVTSESNRTSPVKRGKYILETILGTPPPAPPPNVPALKENDESGRNATTLRARLALHREAATCSTCHSVMDPLGLALENFDAVGRYRTKELGGPIDTAGQLADGTKVSGPTELRDALMKRPDQFVGTMTEKMLTYALGRAVEPHDMPVVRDITRQAARQNYKFSAVVLGIVKSTPFQMKKVPVSGQQVAAR
jgi:mono/diheme cytochrome c family protein